MGCPNQGSGRAGLMQHWQGDLLSSTAAGWPAPRSLCVSSLHTSPWRTRGGCLSTWCRPGLCSSGRLAWTAGLVASRGSQGASVGQVGLDQQVPALVGGRGWGGCPEGTHAGPCLGESACDGLRTGRCGCAPPALQAGDSLDLATLACSLLLGAGYSAYVVVGHTSKQARPAGTRLIDRRHDWQQEHVELHRVGWQVDSPISGECALPHGLSGCPTPLQVALCDQSRVECPWLAEHGLEPPPYTEFAVEEPSLEELGGAAEEDGGGEPGAVAEPTCNPLAGLEPAQPAAAGSEATGATPAGAASPAAGQRAAVAGTPAVQPHAGGADSRGCSEAGLPTGSEEEGGTQAADPYPSTSKAGATSASPDTSHTASTGSRPTTSSSRPVSGKKALNSSHSAAGRRTGSGPATAKPAAAGSSPAACKAAAVGLRSGASKTAAGGSRPPTHTSAGDSAPVTPGERAAEAGSRPATRAAQPADKPANASTSHCDGAPASDAAAAEAEVQPPAGDAQQATPPPPPRPCRRPKRYLHAFVLVKPGRREVSQAVLLDPGTGRTYCAEDAPCSGVECAWNDRNFWASLQTDNGSGDRVSGLTERGLTDWSFSNPNCWLPLLHSKEASVRDARLVLQPLPACLDAPIVGTACLSARRLPGFRVLGLTLYAPSNPKRWPWNFAAGLQD